MKHGPNEEKLLKQIRSPKDRVPDFILNKPKLISGLELYYAAFWDLISERNGGLNGAGRISWMAIDAYAQRIGIIDVDEFDKFKTILNMMDITYLNYIKDKK